MSAPRALLPCLLISPLLPPLHVLAELGIYFTAEPTEPTKLIMGIGLAEATPGQP